MNKNKVSHHSEMLTAILLNLKINYQIPKHLQCCMLFLIAIQPLYFTLQGFEFEEYQQKWQFQIIKLMLRPGLFIVEDVCNKGSYYALITPLVIFLHKLCLSYFGLVYYHNKTQDFFKKQCENSNLIKSMCYFVNVYQFLIPSYLFQDLGYISYLSLKNQLNNYLAGYEIQPFLIFCNIFSILIILIDSILFIFISEQAISNTIQVFERVKITVCRLLQLLMILLQILITNPGALYISQLQAILTISFEFIYFYEIFYNFSFPLQLQKKSLFLAISFNTAFQISFLLRLAYSESIQFQIAQFVVICSLIFNIILIKDKLLRKLRFLNFFQAVNSKYQHIKDGLIWLLNNEYMGTQESLFMKVMISKDHTNNCYNKKCIYCNHLVVLFTEQAFGITIAFYKNFTLRKITQIVQIAEIEKNKTLQKEYILSYALFLYDFGWPLKAIKILDQLNFSTSNNQFSSKTINNLITKELMASQRSIAVSKPEHINERNDEMPTFYLLNFFEKIQIKLAIGRSKQQITRIFLGSSLMAIQQLLIEEFASEFLKNEVEITQLQNQIIAAMKNKLQLYKDIKTHQQQIKVNYKQICQLSEEVYILKKNLKLNYKNQPCPRLHALCCFFYGEILQNYKKAIQLQKKQWHSDSHLNKFQKIQNFDSNQQNFQFAILELQDDMQNLLVKSHSQAFYKFYGQNHRECSIKDLLPQFFREIHSQYLTQFFETGFSKFFNVFNLNFILNPQQLLTTVNMCFTLTNLYTLNNLAFAVFLQETTQDQAFLLVDGGTLNCLLTKNLLLLIGWVESQIEHYSKFEKLDNLKIQTVFPNFENSIKGAKQEEIRLISALFHLPQPQTSHENINLEIQNASFGQTQQKIQFISLECDIIIQKRKINTFTYFIIDIIKITSQTLEKSPLNSSPQRPYSCIISSPERSKVDCFVDDESDSPNIGVLNSINHQACQQNGSIQVLEEFRNLQNMFKVESSNLIKEYHNMQEFNQSKNTENMYQIGQDVVQNDEIMSPQLDVINYSEMHLISKRNISPILNSALHNAKNKLLKLKVKKEIPIIRTKIKSIKNKQVGYPKDKIHKTFELINQILRLNSLRFQKKFFTFLALWHVIFLLLIIVSYKLLTSDLDLFLDYLEMITFHAAVMGPHDLFFSMRATITAYQQMNREGFLPNDHLANLIDPYYEYIDLGYTELRDGLYQQLNNQYLQNFFNNINLTVYFMKDDQTEITPIQLSFRDSLFQVLQYQYAQMMTFHYKESTSGKPFQIFLFANYFLFHDECEKLSNSLQQYTLQMHEIIYNKWIYIWIGFSLILMIFFVFLQCFQQRYFVFLEQFKNLFNCITTTILNEEILRYTLILKQIANDEKNIYDYNPEEELQKTFKKEKINQETRQHTLTKTNSKQRSSIRIYNFAFLFVIMILIFVYITTVATVSNNYFQKYPQTCIFFSQVQDMKLRSGNLFLYREIFFRWSNFTFLTDSNKLELYSLVDKAQSAIKNYISISNTIDFEQYLVNSNFSETFYDINTRSFCSHIDQKFQNLTQRYCTRAFEGSIEKGMLYTLNYISNTIRTQQQINNFSQRVEGTYYEQEGSQIVSRIFFVLALEFQNSWHNVTNSLIFLIQTVSICYVALIAAIFLYLVYQYFPYLGKLLKVNQRMIYFLPFEELMQNEHLIRQLKELLNRFKQQ